MTTLPRHLLPGSLLRLAEYCGDDVMWAVWEHYAGCTVYVPRAVEAHHPLMALLGPNMWRLVEAFGGEILTIPRADAARRAVRDARMRQDRETGAPLCDLARRYQMTERQVSTILHAQDAGRVTRQVDLFEGSEAVPMPFHAEQR